MESSDMMAHHHADEEEELDLTLQNELVKIDQESRAASRAFESRIQKLMNIQVCRHCSIIAVYWRCV